MASNRDIRLIAKLITNDPHTINEGIISESAGQLEANDILLDDTGDNLIYGNIKYTYDVGDISPGSPASWDEYHGGQPADPMNVQITNPQIIAAEAYDIDGQNVPFQPQWEQAALDYFNKHLIDQAIEQAASKSDRLTSSSNQPQSPITNLEYGMKVTSISLPHAFSEVAGYALKVAGFQFSGTGSGEAQWEKNGTLTKKETAALYKKMADLFFDTYGFDEYDAEPDED